MRKQGACGAWKWREEVQWSRFLPPLPSNIETEAMDKDNNFDLAKMRESALVAVLEERYYSKGLSFRKLAAISGMRHNTISDIFRKKSIKMWQVYVLSESLGMSMRELLYLAEERFNEEYSQIEFSDDIYSTS